MQKRALEYTPDPNKFDLRTHIWDAQGRLVKINLYRKYIIQGTEYYERPRNSGNLFFENNQPAGRMELEFGPDGKIASKTLKLGEPHKEFVAPVSGAEAVAAALGTAQEQLLEAQAELAQIKKERDEALAQAKAALLVKPEPNVTKKAGK